VSVTLTEADFARAAKALNVEEAEMSYGHSEELARRVLSGA
jgi:hypothetical protein